VTELEVIEGELVDEDEGQLIEYDPQVIKQAKALDKKIRSFSDRVLKGREQLLDLLNEAAAGKIHEVLGYSSWTAYMKDAVQFPSASLEQRKELAIEMSGKGMPQRAIAAVLGVSQKTVDRDLEGVEFDSQEITTVDNKTVKRNKPKKQEVEEEYEEVVPIKATPIATEYRNEIFNLQNVVVALRDLVYEDDRFPKARTRLAKSKPTDDFRVALDELDGLLVVINGEEVEEEYEEAEG
jgi:transposase